jgi:hypothetical protein
MDSIIAERSVAMPTRITPLDVRVFSGNDLYLKGEKIFENDMVKHRFQTHFGLQATVRSNGKYRVEMIVDGEQLFGRCTCHAGSTPCEHQVATLLAWLNEPQTFIGYQVLRQSIRVKDKTTLVDVLVNLTEVFPELSRFFVTSPAEDEFQAIREDVADIFDYPHAQKINPYEILEPCQILFVRTKLLRNENKWEQARVLLHEILLRMMSLVDQGQMAKPLPEGFIAELADDYEEMVLGDPEFDLHTADIAREVEEISSHASAEIEGVFLDQLKKRLGLLK